MLNIAICTQDGFLRKKFETAITQLMNSNRLDFHLTEVNKAKEIPDKAILILGDSDSLYDYHQRKMMIVVINNHEHDEALSECCLTYFIQKEDLEVELTRKLMHWLDYYYDNYHLSLDEMNEFMLMDVIYFEIHDHYRLTAHLKDKTINVQLKKDFSLFNNCLPLNFMLVGTEYIINLDEVIETNANTVLMSNGVKVTNVDEEKLMGRQKRFDQRKAKDVYIGDKYPKERIRKASIVGIMMPLLIGFVMSSIIQRGFPDMSLLFKTLVIGVVFVLLFLPMYCSVLGATGNYYELKDDGIHYFDALTMIKRFRWSRAIAKGKEEKLISVIPYDDVVCIRLNVRETVSPIGAAFMYYDMKKYTLGLRFETTTSSLDFDGTSLGNAIFGATRYDDVVKIVNRLLLMGKRFEGNDQLLAALNDPNATVQQYMTKINVQTF